MSLERLQKIIARGGKYSRRQAEDLIRQGKVFVDGKKITELGTKVDASTSQIRVSGHLIHAPAEFQYLLFHKPRKCVVTRDDPEGRKTIYDHLPKKYASLKPVGRLDYDSEGLLLLTNDGELAERLTHPRYHSRKLYEVKVQPKPEERKLERLRNGIVIEGRRTMPATVEVILENPQSIWLQFGLREGRNRQIRKMCEEVGLTVKTLVRTQMGPFKLTGIPYGKWREINMTPLLAKKLKEENASQQ